MLLVCQRGKVYKEASLSTPHSRTVYLAATKFSRKVGVLLLCQVLAGSLCNFWRYADLDIENS